jgi:hypothetical protein
VPKRYIWTMNFCRKLKSNWWKCEWCFETKSSFHLILWRTIDSLLFNETNKYYLMFIKIMLEATREYFGFRCVRTSTRATVTRVGQGKIVLHITSLFNMPRLLLHIMDIPPSVLHTPTMRRRIQHWTAISILVMYFFLRGKRGPV